MAGVLDDNSVLRRVHRERWLALAGGRSLLMMAAHPVAFEGFFQSTTSLDEPYERLRRAGVVMDAVVWGERRRAERMCAHVRSAHAKAAGTLEDGTPYRADDPALLLWILACIADSSLLVYERWVRRLGEEDRERYWQEWREVGRLFGIPKARSPRTFPAFRAYMGRMVAEELGVTPSARELGRRIVLDPPVPLALKPLVEAANVVTVGTLPEPVRLGYGLRWDPARELALRGSAEWAKRLVVPLLPDRLRLVPSARAA